MADAGALTLFRTSFCKFLSGLEIHDKATAYGFQPLDGVGKLYSKIDKWIPGKANIHRAIEECVNDISGKGVKQKYLFAVIDTLPKDIFERWNVIGEKTDTMFLVFHLRLIGSLDLPYVSFHKIGKDASNLWKEIYDRRENISYSY